MDLYHALRADDAQGARAELDRLLSAKQGKEAVRQILLAGSAQTEGLTEDPHGLLVAVSAAQLASALGEDKASWVLARACDVLAPATEKPFETAPRDALRESTYPPAALYAALVEGDTPRAVAALRPSMEKGGLDSVGSTITNIAALHMEGSSHAATVPIAAVAAAKMLEGEDRLVPLTYAVHFVCANVKRGRWWEGGWFPDLKHYYEQTLLKPGPRGHHLALAKAAGELAAYADDARRGSLLRQLQLNLQMEAKALPAPGSMDALLAKLAPNAGPELKAAVDSKKVPEVLKVVVANLRWPEPVDAHSLIALNDAVVAANALGLPKLNVGLNYLANGLPY